MKRRSFFLLVLLSTFGCSGVVAQNIAPLKAQLSGNLADTTRALVLSDLSYELRRFKPDSSLELAHQALTLSEKIRYDKGRGRARRMIGIFYYLRGDYPPALDEYEQALMLSTAANDKKNIASCLNNIGNIHHTQSNYSAAIVYFNRSLEMRRLIGDSLGMAQCYSNIGSVYNDRAEYEQALEYFHASLNVCEAVGNKEGMATSYNNIGSTYKAQGNYDKALEYFLYAAKHIVLRGDRPAMAFAYNDIGNVYKDQGNYEKALEYFFNALKLFEEADSKQGIAATLTHLGSIYKDQRDYEKALEYFTQSLSIKTKLGDKRGIANSLRDLGLVYEEQKNTAKALEHLGRALAMREEIGDRYGMTLDCIGIADIHVRNGAPKLALPFLQRSNALTKEIKSKELITGLEAKFAEYYNAIGEPRNALQHAARSMELAQVVRKVEYARNAAEQLYLASAALGQYQEAFKNHQLFIALRDSIQNARNHRASLSREFAFKEEKAQIEQQKKLLEISASRERQKRIAWSLGGIAISIALMLVLVFRSNMQKKKVNRELLEQKHETEVAKEELEKLNGIKNRLLSIISHDVRGPLNSLKALLHLFDNRALTQQEFHDVVANVGHQVGQVNSLLDNLLRWTKNQLDQVKPELKSLALRPLVDEVIGLHALSAKSKHITMHCEVPEALHIYADEEMMKIVVRNLVSNAVKFCEANDVIHIRASAKTANGSPSNAGMARICVEDTGRGISAENLKLLFGVAHLSTKGTNEEIGTGLGLSLCREFVEKCGGQIDVASEEGKGTRFEFTVPLSSTY